MNIIDIVMIKYPGAIESELISFKKPIDSEQILIGDWNIPNVPKPTESDLLAEASTYEQQYNLNKIQEKAKVIIVSLLEETAKSKNYSNSVSCISYMNSTNAQWSAEATAFNSWRDACYEYAFNVFNQIEQGGAIPTEEQFRARLPVITW